MHIKAQKTVADVLPEEKKTMRDFIDKNIDCYIAIVGFVSVFFILTVDWWVGVIGWFTIFAILIFGLKK